MRWLQWLVFAPTEYPWMDLEKVLKCAVARGEYCSSGKYDVLIGWTVAVGPKFERLLQSDSSSYLCDTICHGGQTEAVCLVAKLLLTIWGKLNILLSSIFSIWPKGGNIFEICLVAKLMLTI